MTITSPAPAVGADLTAEPFTITRLGPVIGARITGIDLSQQLSGRSVAAIRQTLLERKVLFFPGQNLTPESHSNLARQFGEPTAGHPVMAPLDDRFPEIWQIDSTEEGATNDIWHTDVTFVPRPPLGSILRAVQLPEFGGDTNWSSLEAAYDSLPAQLQTLADSLVAYHDGSKEFAKALQRRGKGNDWEGKPFEVLEPVEHPVVRVHPETGRKSLFVNPNFTTGIKGFDESDSDRLLQLFFSHITKPEHLIRHRWSEGDVVFWDNRSTAHYANNDYGDFRRLMHRITLRGDEPAGP